MANIETNSFNQLSDCITNSELTNSLNHLTQNKRTPLIQAMQSNRPEVEKMIHQIGTVSEDKDSNSKENLAWAFMYASAIGKTKWINAILKTNCFKNNRKFFTRITDRDGFTPTFWAFSQGHHKLGYELQIKAKFQLTPKDKHTLINNHRDFCCESKVKTFYIYITHR